MQPLQAAGWNRVEISVKKGSLFKIYFNGALLHDASTRASNDENRNKTRFYLDPAGFTLFGDNDGDDAAFDVGEVQVYEGAMSDTRVQALGGAGN